MILYLVKLIDFFHVRFDFSFKRREVVSWGGGVINGVLDTHSEFNHSVDSGGEALGFVQAESRGEERGFVEEPNEVLDSFVGFIGIGLLSEFGDDGMVGVNFHGLLGDHVSGHGAVSKGLSFHDLLHISGPTVFASNKDTWGINNSSRDNDFLNFITEDIFDDFAEVFVGGFGVFGLLLLVFIVTVEVESFLGDADELLAVVFLELLDHVFVDGVGQEDDLEVSLAEAFGEGRVLDDLLAFAGDEVDVFLAFLHFSDIFFQANKFITRFGAVESE